MIKKIIPLAALFFSGYATAQVGVGVKKPAEATMLDISAKDKGVLLPRVTLLSETDTSTIKGEHIESLLVYNIGTTNLKAGFYYWFENKWIPLMSGSTITDTTNKSFTISEDKEKLVITDSQNNVVALAIKDIANNSVFITELADNKEFVNNLIKNNDFITQLVENKEFITKLGDSTEFIENIINKLEGEYGNVSYDTEKNQFFYIKDGKVEYIDWSALDTVNVSFAIDANKENLVITDSRGESVSLSVDALGETIAKNDVFVTNLTENSEFVTKLVENKEFITKLGDNVDFVENITNNNEFIENIINKLEGEYGNVSYDTEKNQFFYIKDGKVEYIDWSNLDTVNVSFAIDANKENLVITDSRGESVSLSVDALGETIAKNDVFVTNLTENSEFVTKLVENSEFITKLGDNIDFVENITNNNEFIENIINKLEGEYGNVSYDTEKNQFFYIKDGKVEYIDWSALDTVNVSFAIDANKENLVITDSRGESVSLSVDALGETIAKNDVFVTNLTENSEFVTKLVENKEFITKLGDKIDFVENITNNNEFIENIINKLEGEYGNVSYDTEKNQFFYIKDGKVEYIDWSNLDTVNVSFAIDANKENLVITDSRGESVSLSVDALGETIAKNDVFVTNLTENSEFVTKLVENKEFITKLGDNVDFVENITNNNEFIENIINKLEGEYGNVSYDTEKNQFFYIKDGKVEYIDWSALDTVNVSFAIDANKENLVITDSRGESVSLSVDALGETIAKNDVFVTNLTENSEFVTKLVENKEFIKKLGDNIDFVENITNNNEFIENIINKLEGEYGNVSYDTEKNQFFYIKDGKVEYIDWSVLDTVNVSFAIDANKENLVITDSRGESVSLSVDALGEIIAKNDVFVTNLTENSEFVTKLVENKEFITKLGDSTEFIENIINKLEGEYGNVSYDTEKNQFFYIKDGKVEYIDWSALDTVNVSFAIDTNKENLVITDSRGESVSLSVDALGETIAKNDVFVTNLTENSEFVTKLVENKEFITKLGDNIDFVENITNNNEFIENIINKLEGEYGNVSYDTEKNQFFYIKDGKVEYIDWSNLDTVNVSFAIDANKENLVITDSRGESVSLSVDALGETIAKNDVFVTNLTENSEFVTKLVENKEFIKKLGDNIDFVENITNNNEFIENIINKLEGEYGNVSYDTEKNQFFYIKDGKVEYIDWSNLDTVNVSFAIDANKENLVITDSRGESVSLSVDALGETIAKNDVFVTNLTENSEFVTKLVENSEFITKLGDNIDFVENITNNNEFIENIINKLEGEYGNVSYDTEKNQFFYIKDGKVEYIDWSALDTVNVSFAIDANKENLVITDSRGESVSLSVDALGEAIANNDVFVTNLTENSEFVTKLVENKEFITKLGDNVDFVENITNNNEFIENIINKLEGEYGNVSYDTEKNQFFYIKDGKVEYIDWSALDTVNVSFAIDTNKENLVITDSRGESVSLSVDALGETIAKNDVFVTNLTENSEFVTKLVENKEFITKLGDSTEFIENIINKLEGEYGNVSYDTEKNQFFYIKDGKVEYIDWSNLDTVNVSFAIDANKENLVIIDSRGESVSLSVDALGETIAKNDVFVTNLTENSEFVTKLVENKEFITKLGDSTEFIENIINKLEGEYGNVSYDTEKNQFFYIKDGKVEYIDWSNLDTVNISFAIDANKENLVITDSRGESVSLSVDALGETIAKNDVFVTNLTENSEFVTKLAENKEFIKKLGDNIDFVENITNNNEFIENIINKLEGEYGNVSYDTEKNQFFYIKDGKVEYIDWSNLDTVNVSFAIDANKENLVITDSRGESVSLSVDALGETIAKNDVFVTNLTENSEFVTKLVENKEFITKLGDSTEFIENIINKLEGEYGNVSYDTEKNQFFYIKDGKVEYIDWSNLDTVNISFAIDANKENLVITDSRGESVSLSVDALGETIAKNDVFVTNLTENSEFVTKLVENSEFITKLGDNIDFVENITNNNEFIENIINKLEGEYGNVSYDTEKNQFFYIKDGKVEYIDWSALDTVNVSFAIDTNKENLVITDSRGESVSLSVDALGETIAKNDVFVTNLTENSEFVTKLVENSEFITKLGDNTEFIENIINKLEGEYGNVSYDTEKNQFFYIKDGKVEYIDWSALDTVNVSFAIDTNKENLVITDSRGESVSLSVDALGETIAKNDVFVTNLTENSEFVTKLVENSEFITKLGDSTEFIENIINKLEGEYGNVSYDTEKNQFFYIKDGKVEYIDWSNLDTVNVSFAIDTNKENLVITDSRRESVSLSVDALGETIAKNDVFVTNLTENSEFVTKLVENKEFITKLGDSTEFIENIINKLEGEYGNVSYDTEKNQFFYIKDGKVEYIDWSNLDTVNVSFAIDANKENLVITDSRGESVSLSVDALGETIAKNDVFVTNLTENSEFVTKLVENKEFITKLGDSTEFIENIINKLEGEYGNVSYDTEKNQFFYIKDGKVEYIDWSNLDTVNISFAIDANKENLVITDSRGESVSLSVDALGETIAKNDVFVTNLTENSEFVTKLVENSEFITKLGDNIDFVENITNNNEFIENIINKLEGEYGNVSYDTEKNQFFYIKDGKVEYIDWSALDTVNVSFAIDTNKENLVITDSRGESVSLSVDALGETIAKNDVFVTNLTENSEFVTKLVENSEFITKLGDNTEFIENIINKLEGEYGNVSYDTEKNQFFYIKDGKVEYIDWSALDTVNVSFAIDTNKENLVITDSRGESVSLSVDALGETIAKNDVFVTNLTENSEFVTKLVENSEFITKLGDSTEFIENIINKLEGEYGNVSYDTEKNQFFYIKDGKVEYIDWSNLDTVNVSFAIDTNKDNLVITDSRGESVSLSVDALGETIAKNDVFVTNLTENKEFITKLGDSTEFIENIINKLEGEYGNVSYDTEKNQFFYIKDGKVEYIDWSNLDTVNISFAIDANKENLVITDSRGESVSLSVDALGETIANNDVFVTKLVENSEFITKLGDNNEFIKQIIKNIEKEALPGTVTVIEKDGDFVFKWKTKDNQDKESSLTDFIKEHSVLASLTLKDSENFNDVKAGFVFNNGANNAADIVFAETLTEIQKGYSKHQVNQEEIELKEYYFIDETREKDPVTIKVSETIIDEFDKIVKFDNVKNSLIDFITNVGGDVSVKKEGEDLVITTKEGTFKVSDVVNAFETNTTITPEEYMVFVYLDEIDGEDQEVHTDVERDDETFTRQYKAIKYVYTNEKGQKKDIKGSELFGQMGGSSGGGFETLTELMFDKDFGATEGQPGTGKAALVYKDEEKVLTPIYISDMFKESAETLTSLAIDENANSLVYKDERGISNYVSLNDINQEPWYTGNDEKATKNDQDIYTMGWVGIGYKDKSGAPNEKLRVNGSITATNSYYADYVFESYFDGYSTLKYDYKFNDLNTVDSYIKSNRHLPGITPISDLEKTETGYSFNVSELSIQLLEKTEELFLHVIDQQKELNAKDKEIQDLKNDVNDLAKRLEALEALLK